MASLKWIGNISPAHPSLTQIMLKKKMTATKLEITETNDSLNINLKDCWNPLLNEHGSLHVAFKVWSHRNVSEFLVGNFNIVLEN